MLWVRIPPEPLKNRHALVEQSGVLAILSRWRSRVRIHPGSLKRRSVGVAVARRRGKAEDRVRVPDGPLARRAVRSTAGHLVCTQVIGVRLPGGPLRQRGLIVQGEDVALAWRRSQFNSGWVHYNERKVAGYGWPGRTANAVLPCGDEGSSPLPSALCPDGERDDHAAVLTRCSGFKSWSGC